MDNKQKSKGKLLTDEEKTELSNFKKWLEAKKYSPKTLDEVKKYYAQYLREKKQMALHGAKLNYFKNLKHQCANDEELYYYKKGGIVDCGCKKKGGDIEPKKECGGGPVTKFKMARKGTEIKKSPVYLNLNMSNKKGRTIEEFKKARCGSKMKKK